MHKICIVGMGNMGSAMFDSIKKNGVFEVVGCDRNDDVNNCLSECNFVIIAIKPQDFSSLCDSIHVDLSDKITISIMAGISLKKLFDELNIKKIVRVMPNLPLKCEAGFSGWISIGLTDEEKAEVVNILKCFGTEIELSDEDKIDAITALSGSGPAYYYALNRALGMKALKMGFSDEESRKIVRGTFLGAAKLLEKSEDCSEKLIQKIASKSGTTEVALNHFEEKKFNSLIEEAVEKAYRKAKELNEN